MDSAVTFDGHYIFCADPECDGCLPDDESVGSFNPLRAAREMRQRGMAFVGPMQRISVLLADADDYRARSAATRSARLGG